MRRSAQVDARGDRLLVSSWSSSTHGTRVQGDWIEAVGKSVEDQALGSLVRAALGASRTGVPFPDFRQGPTPERLKLLKLAGVKSEAQYARGARSVAVDSEQPESDLKVTPYRNGGQREGFIEMLDRVITVHSGADDAVLGAAVRRGLALATDGT
jgi:hypothetical protein